MGIAALIRTAFTDANNYAQKLKAAKADDLPDRNLKHEALTAVLNGKVQALFCAQRAEDILTALRLSREFKLKPMVALATEGYLVADELAKQGVSVVLHPTMQRVGNLETYNTVLGNAGALADANVRIAIGSGVESYVPKSRVVRYEAAMAMIYGLGYERALRSITLDAAKILGIDDRFGSIEVGKTADLVLYDGDLFEHATHVTYVVVDGKIAFQRSKRPLIPVAGRLFYSIPDIPCCLGF